MKPGDGKWGLALSGGGFRAAFFHVGVLAQMADLGLLRRIEVISTVSGGSIIGALYYLHVKRLLEEKPDGDVTDQDYVDRVKEIEAQFLKAVQKNVRVRTFLNPLKNLRMMSPRYSRSDRIGELYDEYFYRPIFNPTGNALVQMQELKIQPKQAPHPFDPDEHNGGRTAKVPILLINATTLNTGHNWRFEAVRMGEPSYDDAVDKEVDKNLRLRRPSYGQIRHTRHHTFELGLAVAASACVPGIFPPLAISNLYPRGIRVQLVDGGVHDNQGIQGLRDEHCTHLVVSDASGWLEDEYQPPTPMIPTMMRGNDILMDRVREEELSRLYESRHPLAFMHLRKGLPAEAISWMDPVKRPIEPPKGERIPQVSSQDFGVHPDVQDRLSLIRTDLDSFTDIEANSLMLDGYNMSGLEIPSRFGIPVAARPRSSAAWDFQQIQAWMSEPTPEYLRHLQVARENLFKVFWLSPAVAAVTVVVGLALLFGLWVATGPWVRELLSSTVTIGSLLLAILVFAIGVIPQLAGAARILRFLRPSSELLMRVLVRALLPTLGSLFVAIHLYVFDPLFLRLGKLERLRRGKK